MIFFFLRYFERGIRRWKREYLTAEEMGEDSTEAAVRLKAWREKEADFLKQTGRRRDSSRSQVGGFSHSQASKATWIAKNYDLVEEIGRSVGAKAKNYRIYNPLTGDFTKLAEGTHIIQPKNHIMAGYGRDRQIDCIAWLVDKHGGDAVKWTKEKGFGFVEDEYGDIRKVELHWYQEPSVGRVEMKIKERNGELYIDDI